MILLYEPKVIFSFIHLDLLVHQANDKALLLEAKRECDRTIDNLINSHSANSHVGTYPRDNRLKKIFVNDVVLNCSSLPGVAESCPHSGLCDLKAHS